MASSARCPLCRFALSTATPSASRFLPFRRAFSSASSLLAQGGSSSGTSSDDSFGFELLGGKGSRRKRASDSDKGAAEASVRGRRGVGHEGFTAWLKKEGARFKDPKARSTNWIGDTPFPLNPSFNPPPPLSDALKTKMWETYVSAPDKYTPRELSRMHNVAIARVEAVLRLKAVEEEWKMEGKPIQRDFQKKMESYLAVTSPSYIRSSEPEVVAPTLDRDRAFRGVVWEDVEEVAEGEGEERREQSADK